MFLYFKVVINICILKYIQKYFKIPSSYYISFKTDLEITWRMIPYFIFISHLNNLFYILCKSDFLCLILAPLTACNYCPLISNPQTKIEDKYLKIFHI